MIVKNEAKNLPRLFDSLFLDSLAESKVLGTGMGFPLIKEYVILDTGSTDKTPEIIRTYWEGRNNVLPDNRKVRGKVGFSVFKNFGESRNEALQQAYNITTCDWIMFLDADMCVEYFGSAVKDILEEKDISPKVCDVLKQLSRVGNNVCSLKQYSGRLEWWNTRLVKKSHQIKCIGVTHEYYDTCNDPHPVLQFKNILINDVGDGGSKDNKFSRDILLLTEGIKKEPTNTRYYFYLAQSYINSPSIDDYKQKAITLYKKRIELGGWAEETWYCYYKIVCLNIDIGDINEAEKYTFLAYGFRPIRTEAIYKMCKYFREQRKYPLAYRYYLMGKDIPKPNDTLFVESNVYEYEFEYEYSIILYYMFPEKKVEGMRVSMSLLNNKRFTENPRLEECILSNMRFYICKLPVEWKRIELKTKETSYFFDSSTGMLFDGDRIILNVRKVNYNIDKTTGGYTMRDGEGEFSSVIVTKNVCLIMDTSFNLISEIEMEDDNKTIFNNRTNILGVEDVRLYEDRDVPTSLHRDIQTLSCDVTNTQLATSSPPQNNSISLENNIIIYPKFIACTKQYCSGNKVGIVTGTYNFVSGKLIIEKHIDSPEPLGRHEKNWTVFPNGKILYTLVPFQWGEIKENVTTGYEMLSKHKFYRLKTETITDVVFPSIFGKFRGSANPVVYKDLVFTTFHIVGSDGVRNYYHSLVIFGRKRTESTVSALEDVFDKVEYVPLCYSSPFTFEGEKIEYNLGIGVKNGEVFLTYSLWDNCSKIVSCPLWWWMDRMLYLSEDARITVMKSFFS